LIGVLALQGDFEAHRDALARAGVAARDVRSSDEILASTGLVIPGGESTAMRLLMEGTGIEDAIRAVAGRGDPVLGTCAGAILLARDVEGPRAPGFGLLRMTVVRNAYGRQLDSAVVRLTDLARAVLGEEPLEAVFIRAPRISAVDSTMEVLARRNGDPVLVRKANIMAATFHPELTLDPRVHAVFLSGRVSA
jgi:pyridoxal 5'-phosphate synthase pdxT subunit